MSAVYAIPRTRIRFRKPKLPGRQVLFWATSLAVCLGYIALNVVLAARGSWIGGYGIAIWAFVFWRHREFYLDAKRLDGKSDVLPSPIPVYWKVWLAAAGVLLVVLWVEVLA